MDERGLDSARAARDKALALFADLAVVNGVGITRKGGRYAIKVNVESLVAPNSSLPTNIDGVPVVVSVVGKLRKQRPVK